MEYNAVNYSQKNEVFEQGYVLVEKTVFYLNMYSKTWSDESYSLFLKTLNEYLDAVKPVTYIPSIANKLMEQTIIPLWGVSFNLGALERLLISIIEVKQNNRVDNLVELRENLVNVLTGLGVEKADEIVQECRNSSMEEDCLVYASILTVILATNP